MIPAFPKILHLGARGAEQIYNGPVEASEKIDGSQYSLGKINGDLHMRSKGAAIFAENPPKMFEGAVEWTLKIQDRLPDNFAVHGEYLRAPKHNTLTYSSVPKNGFAIFGIRELPDRLLNYDCQKRWADILECDVVPRLYEGELKHENISDQLDEWLNTESALGGPKIEGIVIKNYTQTGLLGGHILPILCCKFVSEQFKEKHKTEWKATSPSQFEKIGAMFATEARWLKAIQYRRDCGELEESLRDIGPLLKQIQDDIDGEERELIKEKLYDCFRKDIFRVATRGFVEFYKKRLVEGDIEK